MTTEAFDKQVKLKFQLFNSLFLTLPFKDVADTGMLLPIFHQQVSEGVEQRKKPDEIIHGFFENYGQSWSKKDQIDLLYRFVQYVERQVVLFDALEDAAFESIHDLQGKGTWSGFMNRIQTTQQAKMLKDKLSDFGVRIVLTAHPTQFYPGQVLSIITDLEKGLRSNQITEVNSILQQLGRTPIYRRTKPSPLDEAISLIWYLENVLYDATGQLLSSIRKKYPELPISSQLVRLGFWPGGDRDGNPFVTHDITLATARKLKEAILRCYWNDIKKLKRRLTFPETEPIAKRLEAGLESSIYELNSPQYQTAAEILEELKTIKNLLSAKYNALYVDEVEDFITKVECFGFFFASLDVRQDSRVHREVMQQVLTQSGDWDTYTQLSGEKEKIAFWEKWKVGDLDLGKFEGISFDTLKTIQVLREIQAENGPESVHRYIISNTRNAEDLHILKALFKAAGWRGDLPFDLIPLFETVEDLTVAPQVMESLYLHPDFASQIAQRGNKQTIMLGFSDGTKDGGYLTANWKIFQAKRQLSKLGRKYGIKSLFFDGRGGPPARGGGDTHAFYSAHGSQIDNHEIQITIQGQTISSKFGNLYSAKFNIEQLLTAGLSNHVFPDDNQEISEAEERLLDDLSKLSLDYYTQLKNHPDFLNYLENATVLNFYGETNVGSRPAKRKKADKLNLDDLRAIPFVGAWSQMKQNVPGFYGLGYALEQKMSAGAEQEVLELYRNSLFFKALLQNSMQSLAKSNFKLTEYLKDFPEFSTFWEILKEENKRAKNTILKVSGNKSLLEDAPVNLKSIKLREKIVLPLLMIQQYALLSMRRTDKEEEKEIWKKLIVRCFFGNINASRNSA